MISDSLALLSKTFQTGQGYQWFPDPFLDYSGLYTPRNLRSMLRWCELMWAHNGTYRMALERVVAYFITKVDILETSDVTKKRYQDFLNNTLNINSQLRNVGLDFIFYGNSFTTIYVPFKRYLRCKRCKLDRPIEKVPYVFTNYKFHSNCPKCNYRGEFDLIDRRTTEPDKFKIVRLSPHQMILLFHPLSHSVSYLYRIPEDFKGQIRRGTPFYVQHTPWEFIEAIKENQLFQFNDDVIFHMKEDTLAGLLNRGWGIPRALSNFKQGFYIQVLKRYNEALALDYIVPWRVITPAMPPGPLGKVDPLLHANLGDFASRIRGMIAEHRRDPLAMHSLPFPITYQVLGGEAKTLAPHELLTVGLDELLNSVGVPAELYKGTLSLQAMPTALRLFEATWPHLVSGFNNWLNWLMKHLSDTFNWEKAEAKLVPVTRADDIEARTIRLQLSAANKISDSTALAPFGIDVREEIRRMFEEQKILQEEQEKFMREQQEKQLMEQRVAETAARRAGLPAIQGVPGPQGGMVGPMGAPGSGQGGMTTPGDILQQADQLAQQLLAMPEGERRRQLNQIKRSDETLHAVVKQKLQQYRTQARSVGQDMVLQQMIGGGGPPIGP